MLVASALGRRPHRGGRVAGGLEDRGDLLADGDEVGGLAGRRRRRPRRAVGRFRSSPELPAEDPLGLLELGDGAADAVEEGVDFGLVVALSFDSEGRRTNLVGREDHRRHDRLCTCWSRGFQVECCEILQPCAAPPSAHLPACSQHNELLGDATFRGWAMPGYRAVTSRPCRRFSTPSKPKPALRSSPT